MSGFNITPELEEMVRQAVSVPEARPEFVNQLRMELASRPVKTKPRLVLRPAWAVVFVLVLAMLVISVPQVAGALRQIFGYLPDLGLVENTGDLRMLAEPVSVTRDGVTLTVKNVIAYPDRVELVYEVQGIDPSNDGSQAGDYNTNPTAFCGGVNIGETASKDGDARLRLPDGTVLEREPSGLYPQNAFAMTPVYQASLPAGVTEMTLVLDCIPWARRGAVPENWEVPLKLVIVPPGTVPGSPVIDVPQPTGTATLPPATAAPSAVPPTAELPALPSPQVTLRLEKIALTQPAVVVYFSMDVVDRDPSLVSIMPREVYISDSTGQRIQLMASWPWQPFEHRPGSLFEFVSSSKPAEGPLTLVVENAVAYYAPLYVEPRQATPEEMSFTFDAGPDPQRGQTWQLSPEFEIAGYPFQVTSARAVVWEDVETPEFIDGSQGFDYGYQFSVQGNPAVKMNVEMDIVADQCGFTVGVPFLPESSALLNTQLCRDEFPKGAVKVLIREVSVLLEGAWQATWDPTTP